MGQKIHPLGLRLGITQTHRSKWFANKMDYPRLVLEDRWLRAFLYKKYPQANISDILIERQQPVENIQKKCFVERIKVSIQTAKPTVLIDIKNRDASLKVLRKTLQTLCRKKREQAEKTLPKLYLQLSLSKATDRSSEASEIADGLIEELENRTAFRQALKKAKKDSQEGELKGARIQISGRLNGAEIARIEWTRHGRVPLQTLRADVDYAAKTAKTVHGILGIKVWTFKKEKI